MNMASFLLYCLIVTFTPGPTNIVILSSVRNFGAKQAMKYVWGATAAFGTLLVLSAIFNSAMVALVPKLLSVMRIIGSLYMLYLAYLIYKAEGSETAARQTATARSGFLMQFVNPKVVLFTMTVIPSFVMPYYRSPLALAAFAAAITAIGFAAFVTWLLCGTVFKGVLQKYQKTVTIMMALFLVYSAIMVSGIIECFGG